MTAGEIVTVIIFGGIIISLVGMPFKSTLYRSSYKNREESAEQIAFITALIIILPIKIYREICTIFGWHAVIDVKIKF